MEYLNQYTSVMQDVGKGKTDSKIIDFDNLDNNIFMYNQFSAG